MAPPNVFDDQFDYDADDVAGYRSGQLRVGAAAGGTELSVRVYEIPAGESVCPYHYEYVEEWLVVLHGELELRRPDETETVRDGDVVCFPAGPAGAHKVTNPGGANARILMFSSAAVPAVAVYPDSDKVGVWTDTVDDAFMFRRDDGSVPYYDGERGTLGSETGEPGTTE
jgi:uncharacterized cupin superfamily protein